MSRAGFGVRRSRISHLAVRVNDDVIEALGDPDRFEALIAAPGAVAGLQLGLPYDTRPWGGRRPVAWQFWSNLTEDRRLGKDLVNRAGNLRRYGLPLRHAVPTVRPSSGIELEVFCYPFGWTVVATSTLQHHSPLQLEDLTAAAALAGEQVVECSLAGTKVKETVRYIADKVADGLAGCLAAAGGNTWSLPSYRIASVIDATGVTGTEMPAQAGDLHRALHELALGGPALPDAASAFIPYWTGSVDFGWAPTELIYVLDRGCAQFRQEAALQRPPSPRWGTSEFHRLLVLTRLSVSSAVCLVRAAGEADSDRLTAWARDSAYRLSRLYGPAPAGYDFWGLTSRAFIRSIPGAARQIRATRDDRRKLTGKRWPDYPIDGSQPTGAQPAASPSGPSTEPAEMAGAEPWPTGPGSP